MAIHFALLLLSALVGDTFADDITAIRAEVYSSQDLSVTLSCNYSVKANNLQWYRQYPGSAPQFLLLITDTTTPTVVEAKPPIPRMSVQLKQKRNGVDLEISSAEVTDSALYEGNNITLSYKYSEKATGTDYFFWYRQDPGKPPEFLLSIAGYKDSAESLKSDPRISTKLSEDKRGVDLEISSAEVTHSALYYCSDGLWVETVPVSGGLDVQCAVEPPRGEKLEQVVSRV
ncbi:uncharacterized protein LOC115375390 [Myripristis murdjan]|uniref:uncharacterized protein LOC115375390 n=1 Tax=Myripristis murdjan TaxID=586833 RepID=UPI0011764A21|nr:uncharacterized protein LOC115375390 [Myripristis murdjan]